MKYLIMQDDTVISSEDGSTGEKTTQVLFYQSNLDEARKLLAEHNYLVNYRTIEVNGKTRTVLTNLRLTEGGSK